MQDTLIVVTSDHGDFLGDHWMGEKMFFQNASVKVPMIIYDPSTAADATRGTTSAALVECIDLAPTFVQVAGGAIADHILEGESLLPLLRNPDADTRRDFVICEYDYSASPISEKLGLSVRESAMFMVADTRWKLVHFEGGFRPILFDLQNDPQELVDLGADPDHADTIAAMYDKLFRWTRRNAQRTTRSTAQLEQMRRSSGRRGVMIGIYDENDVPLELTVKYRGLKVPDRSGSAS